MPVLPKMLGAYRGIMKCSKHQKNLVAGGGKNIGNGLVLLKERIGKLSFAVYGAGNLA